MKDFKDMNEIIKAENDKKKIIRIYIAALLAVQLLAMPLTGCAMAADSTSTATDASGTSASVVAMADDGEETNAETSVVKTSQSSGDSLSLDNIFTERDLQQTADLSEAKEIALTSGKNVTISKAGVYHVTGSAENVTIIVDAGDEDKVQIVLDGVSITNSDVPCIYVKNADKVFVTLTGSNSLSVTGKFTADGDTNTDGVIFSKDDLTLNGTGSLTVNSTDNGIVGKDDLKITGGAYSITASSKAIEANDSIRIADGSFTVKAGTDGLHAENEDDDSLGYIYIGGGTFSMNVGDDGIHAVSLVQIDGGRFTISAAECVEGTYIRINGGTFDLSGRDDGINAAKKSGAYATPTVEINGGTLNITMSAGDTDGIDSNGDIIVNGGTISVTGNSTFDYDGAAQFNGGTIYCNGQQVTSIPNQMMGGRGGMGGNGGMNGGNGGNMGDRMGGRGRRG
ncbi:MAG: carbohydrate-binding domain-containing protein [Clostridia bacterium]|nr:carbohydrate-binding domain-containing protein [Clostridia bacterium]